MHVHNLLRWFFLKFCIGCLHSLQVAAHALRTYHQRQLQVLQLGIQLTERRLKKKHWKLLSDGSSWRLKSIKVSMSFTRYLYCFYIIAVQLVVSQLTPTFDAMKGASCGEAIKLRRLCSCGVHIMSTSVKLSEETRTCIETSVERAMQQLDELDTSLRYISQ